MFGALRARIGYLIARRLFHWSELVKQPQAWRWMEGQFARMAALGDTQAQSFYGHILLFRGQGLGARNEGRRLLSLAATAGDAKAAYQLGVLSLSGDAQQAADAAKAGGRWLRRRGTQLRPIAWLSCTAVVRQVLTLMPCKPSISRRYPIA